MDERKYETWYDEICLGKQRIRKVGNSYVITLPKSVLVNDKVPPDAEVIPIILVRKRRLLGELKTDEEWIRLTKKDRIRFKAYLKEKEELERVISKKAA